MKYAMLFLLAGFLAAPLVAHAEFESSGGYAGAGGALSGGTITPPGTGVRSGPNVFAGAKITMMTACPQTGAAAMAAVDAAIKDKNPAKRREIIVCLAEALKAIESRVQALEAAKEK